MPREGSRGLCNHGYVGASRRISGFDLHSLAWPDRFFPFFGVPKEKRKKAVWPRETKIYKHFLANTEN